MKKRLLSLILAITMIASILPTMALSVSAADVSYTYSFNPNGLASGTALNTYKYADTNNMWEYVAAKSLNTSSTYPQTYKRSAFSGMFIRWVGSAVPWAAFRIKVPTAGVYKATIKYGERHVGTSINVYVLPSSVTTLSGSESSFDGIKLNSNPVITLNAEQTGNVSEVKPISLENTFTTVADNEERIVVFDADDSNKQQYLYVSELVLEKVGDVCTVTYDANGGTVEEESAAVGVGEKIILPTPAKDESEFLGWSDGTNTYEAASEYVVNASVTLVAQWKKLGADAFVYDFGKILGEVNTEAEYTTFADTFGMWQMNTKSREALSILKYAKGFRARTSAGYWVSFKINVPASGKYNVFLNHYQLVAGTNIKAGYGNVYLIDGNTENIENALKTAIPLNAEEVAYASSEIESNQTPKTKLCEEYEIEKGEYILVLYSTRKHPDCHNEAGTYAISLVLEGEAAKEAYAGAVSLAKSELIAGESTTAETLIFNTETNSAVAGDVTYKSSDEKVAKVDGNSVKAIGAGTAEIIAEYSGALASGNIVSAQITVVDSSDDSVIFGKATNVNSKIEIDGTLRRGDTVILNAEDIEGYNFVGWKRGNAVTGKFIVGAPQKNFEYKVYSNAFVTAIYEEKNPDVAKGVELWNQNGELIAKYDADEFKALSKLPTPTLIGYEFVGYKTGDGEEFKAGVELSNGITHAVAEFEPISVSGPFYCDDVQNEISDSMKFNSPIIASTTSSTFSCWVRNNMVVSYDKDYTYYVWSAADINNSKIDVPDDKKPIVILEEGYGAYMIEFDDADYTIVEAGIIAGNGTPTVSSALEKHIAQKVGNHGQFAVKLSEDYDNVRGYVIYIDGATFKIAYSD